MTPEQQLKEAELTVLMNCLTAAVAIGAFIALVWVYAS